MLNDQDSKIAAEHARMITAEVTKAYTRPSVLYRPALRRWEWPDERGIYWTATYGDVEGKGARPKDAMTEFDLAWQRYEYSAHENKS
jgi:hypothetical protein